MYTHTHTHTYTHTHTHTRTRTHTHVCDIFPTERIYRGARHRPKAAHTETMLVTAAVFQPTIGPYVVAAVAGLLTHASAAVLKFALVMAVCAATCMGKKRSSASPARRCDRNVTAELYRKRHDVSQRNATRRVATQCDTWQRGMCCTVLQRRELQPTMQH
jgi:hypothetical protein